MFQYFLKVVSTQFRTLDGKKVSGYWLLSPKLIFILLPGEHTSVQHDTI